MALLQQTVYVLRWVSNTCVKLGFLRTRVTDQQGGLVQGCSAGKYYIKHTKNVKVLLLYLLCIKSKLISQMATM